jgi:hypothetical protein
LIKTLMAGLAGILLTGCVLQSNGPLISDNQAKPLLKDYGLKFANYNFVDGAWKKEADGVMFVADHQHYVVVNSSSKLNVSFVPLGSSWWLAQYSEKKNQVAYGLIEARKDALYVYPLACKEIQKLSPKLTTVSFVNDECFAAADMTIDDFKKLLPAAGEQMLKLVPEK